MSVTLRIALITGANKGIGFESARQIGNSGLRILTRLRLRPTSSTGDCVALAV